MATPSATERPVPTHTPGATATHARREPRETPRPDFVSFTDPAGEEVQVVAIPERVFLAAADAEVAAGPSTP
jgi:hypothetical protein